MKTIVLLGGGSEQLTVIQQAKELGYRIVVLDENPYAPGAQIANEFFCCNIRSIAEVYEITRRSKADGIMVHAVEIPQVVAAVANKLNLPGVSLMAAINATNKLRRLGVFEKEGVPCPRHAYAMNVDEAIHAGKELGYPVVIKPADNAGSRGVIYIEKESEMRKYFQESVSQLKNESRVIVEEFLDGPQISTETVVYGEKMYTVGFSDRNYSDFSKYKPYFVEDGGDMPSNLPVEMQRRVTEVAEAAIKALRINFGAAKGDLVLHNGKPFVIEMAARTSGGRFATHQIPAATGVNIIKALLKMAVSDPVDISEFAPKFNHGSSQRYLIPTPGRIKSISGIEHAKKLPGVYSIIVSDDLKVGTIVPRPIDNTVRKGVVMASASGREQARNRAIFARNTIKIVTEPVVSLSM